MARCHAPTAAPRHPRRPADGGLQPRRDRPDAAAGRRAADGRLPHRPAARPRAPGTRDAHPAQHGRRPARPRAAAPGPHARARTDRPARRAPYGDRPAAPRHLPHDLLAPPPRRARRVRHPERQVRPVAPDRFRTVMGRFPTGVTVVTAMGPEGPVGMTANAVASLSLEPLLLLVCFDNGARTLRVVREAGRFGVNVLAAGQESLARRFAGKLPESKKFAGVAFALDDGVPVVEGAHAW